MQRLALTILFAAVLQAQDLPRVVGVEPQPVLAQAQRLRTALAFIGNALPEAVATELIRMSDQRPTAGQVDRIQKLLDPFCLVMVEINPEARVKVRRGPAAARINQKGWKSFLVKVHNAAGLTSSLRVVSPNSKPLLHRSSNQHRARPGNKLSVGQVASRFLELAIYRDRPMQTRLSGLALEYAILQVYCRDSGRREAKLGFNAGDGTEDLANRSAISVLFDCAPAIPLTFRVRDEAGNPVMASFTISDGVERVASDRVKHPLDADYRHSLALEQPWDTAKNPSGYWRTEAVNINRLRGIYPLPARRLVREGYPDFFFQPQVYRTDGEHVLLPPGVYDIQVSRGPEYFTQSRRVTIEPGATGAEVEFRLERWVHLKALGWYSLDHHVHAAGCSHYESPEEGVRPEDMFRQALGEDLNVACVLTWGPCWYFQKNFFEGKSHELSKGSYLMRFDVEVSGFPSSHAGHICLLRLREDDYPGTKTVEDWPSWTLPILQWAKQQGGVVGYAHSGWGLAPQKPTTDFPNYVLPKYNGIGANEYIVTVAHHAVDLFSAGDTPLHWELNMWYHTLNVGFRPRISGETDFPCIFDERVGMARSYAKVDGKLTFDACIDSLKQGRCYVSDGKSHIIDFEVDAVELGVKGSELRLDAPQEVAVSARVAAYLPVRQNQVGAFIASRDQTEQPYWDIERSRIGKTREVVVELVVNGQSVAKQRICADGNWAAVAFKTKILRSSWVALRVMYSSHTNPIFIEVGGNPIRASRRSAVWCRQGVDVCWQEKFKKIDEDERAAAKAAYDEARRIYDRLIGECFDDR